MGQIKILTCLNNLNCGICILPILICVYENEINVLFGGEQNIWNHISCLDIGLNFTIF